jgi:D-alanyl-D-alanine carboxypeptidase (penicillin-binding protein 5/6)
MPPFVTPLIRALQYTFIGLAGMLVAMLAIPGASLAPTGTQPQVLGASITNSPQATELNSKANDLFPNNLNAKAALAYDPISNQVYAQKQIDTPLAIASITKLMTALLALESGPLNTPVTVTSRGTTDIRPRLAVTPGEQIALGDLIKSILVGSVNDGALILGDYLTRLNKRPVVEQMNQRASELGMQNSHFANTTGFDSEQNYATARDLSLLVNRLRDIPTMTEVNQLRSYQFRSLAGTNFTVKATNKLIGPQNPELRAIKTGFTEDAGGAMITEVALPKQSIVLIVLGSNQREKDSKILERYVLEQLEQQP